MISRGSNFHLGLWQNHIERILAGWVQELEVPVYRARELAGFTQHSDGVDAELADGAVLRAKFLVGCDGGRSLVRNTAVLIRPDGYVAWVGEGTDAGLVDSLTTWFGAPRPA